MAGLWPHKKQRRSCRGRSTLRVPLNPTGDTAGHLGHRFRDMGPRAELLERIEHAVLSDGAPPGLTGCLRIGIAHPTGERWLEVRLDGDSAQAGAPRSGGADVTLLLGDYEAKRLLSGRRLPHRPLFSVRGDGVLLSRFVERYLTSERWVGLREGTPSAARDKAS